jgi:hypothetical protein
MDLTPNDLCILHFAAGDPEGRLSFFLTEEGTIALTRRGVEAPVPAGDAFPGLEEKGLLVREVSRSFVLSVSGWEMVQATAEFAR